MARLLPALRLVLILRNPIERAYSEYHMKVCGNVCGNVCGDGDSLAVPYSQEKRRVDRQLDVKSFHARSQIATMLYRCYSPFSLSCVRWCEYG